MNKAAGGTRALQRVDAPGHRLERLPCTAAATGGVWREAAQRRLAVEILMGGWEVRRRVTEEGAGGKGGT